MQGPGPGRRSPAPPRPFRIARQRTREAARGWKCSRRAMSSASHSCGSYSALACGKACGEDEAVVRRCIEIAHARGLLIAAARVELPRRRIVGARRGLHDEEPCSSTTKLLLYPSYERASTAAPLRGRMNGEPVQIEGAFCGGRRAAAPLARQRRAFLGRADPLPVASVPNHLI